MNRKKLTDRNKSWSFSRRVKFYIKKSVLLLFLLLIYSCQDIVGDVDISNEKVSILAPSDGYESELSTINFNWETLGFADQYQIRIARPNFENAEQIIVDTLVGSANSSNNTFVVNLDSGFYEWRIRGINNGFVTDYETRSLSVVESEMPLSEQLVDLIAPQDMLETASKEVQLEWDVLEDATLYRVMIINIEDNIVFLESTTTDNKLSVDFVSGNYRWSVRAENDTQHTAYSERLLTILE